MSFAPKTESPALSPSTPDRRNTYQEAQAVPFANGYARFAPKWVSDRFNDHWSNGKQSGQAYCSVVGILEHGPLDYFQGIYSGGKLVAWPDILRPDNPLDPNYWSVTVEFGGADADLGPSNRLRLHWGREDQPADSWLVAMSGQDHPPYPGQVVVVFERLHCGQIQANSQQQPALPNIEISGVRLPSPSVPTGLRLPAALGAARWRGINLVSGLWDALTHPRAGAGLSSATLDEADWIAKATALESGAKPAGGLSGADAYVSPVLSGSAEVEKVVMDGLSYIDGWFHTVGGKIRLDWHPNDGTPGGTLPELSEHDMVETPKVRTGSLAEAPTSIVVECLEGDTAPHDLVEAVEQVNVPFVRQITGETSPKKLQRPWFTSREIAHRYGTRAAALATVPLMDGECRVRLHRAVRLDDTPLRVGDLFWFNYGPLSKRVVARLTERMEDETTATLRWRREPGIATLPYVPATDPRATYTLPDPPSPGTDDWTIAEAPRGLSEIAAVVALVRRPSDSLSGLRLYLDEDNNWVTGATLLGPQGFAARVTLSGAIGDGATSCTLLGTDPDVSPILGSGTTTTEQSDDTLIMLMGTEWISLGSVVSAGAGAYTVGLSRGRLGSAAAAQADGVYGWVIRRDRVTLWSNAVFAQLATRYFKVAYFHALADGPLSAAKAVTFADRKPGVASSFTAIGLPGAIKLTWNNPTDTDLLGAQIYESATTTKPSLPSWSVAFPGNTFTRDDLAAGATRHFWIEEVDQAGNVSNAVGPVNATPSSGSAGSDGVGAWTPTLVGTATSSGGSVYKKTGSAAWDSSVYSQEGYYRGAAMGAKAGALGDVAFGLDASPAASPNNTTIDYAFRLWAGGQIDIVENGTVVLGAIGVQVANTTVFQIIYDNAKVRYYVDGVLKREVAAAADQTLYLDTSLYTVDASNPLIRNLTFAAAGAVGTPAVTAQVTGPAYVFSRANAAASFAPTTITLTATLAGATATTWAWQYWNGAAWVTAPGSANTATYVVNHTDFVDSRQHRCVINGAYTDEVTIIEVTGGTNAKNGYLTNESHTLPATSAGVVTSWTGAGGSFVVYDGSTDVTASSAFSIIANPNAVTASIHPTTGVYSATLPGSWSSGSTVTTITFRATYAGVNIDRVFTLTKSLAGVQGDPGTPGSPGSPGSPGANGAGYGGTSSTSLAIGTGSKSFTTQTGLAYQVGQVARLIYASGTTQFMEGPITAYNPGTGAMTINSLLWAGSGTYGSWLLANVGLSGFGATNDGIYAGTGVKYYCNSVRQSIVYVGTTPYRAINPAKNDATGWGAPASTPTDWAAADATIKFLAAGIALIDNATINKTLIMGDGTADAGIFRSYLATDMVTGAGYYANPRSSAHANTPVFRVGTPGAGVLSFDNTGLKTGGFTIDANTLTAGSGANKVTISSDSFTGIQIGDTGHGRIQLTNVVAPALNIRDTSGIYQVAVTMSANKGLIDVGSSIRLFDDQMLGAYGTAAKPAWAFRLDPDTGIYQPTGGFDDYSNHIFFGTGGAYRAMINSAGLTVVAKVEAGTLKQAYLEAGVTTAVDVKDVNLRIYNGGSQSARIDFTTGRYYIAGTPVLNTRWAGAAPSSFADVWAIFQHHGLG